MEGLSPEHNEVFLEVPTEDLVHSTSSKEGHLMMKLTQINNIPHLLVEVRADCTIKHEIPVVFVKPANWQEYEPPLVGLASVALALPEIKVMHRILSSMKNMTSKIVTFKANNNGELCLNVGMDTAKIEVYIRNLVNMTILGGTSQEMPAVDRFFCVELEMRFLHSFFSNLNIYFNRIVLKIVDGRAGLFYAKQSNCHFTFYLASQNMDC